MDSAASTALLAQLDLFKDAALSSFASVVPLAGAILITSSIVMFAIRFFRKIMHMDETRSSDEWNHEGY